MEILNYMQEENEITEVCESVYTTTEITFKIRTEVSRMLSVSKVITLSQVKEVFQTSRKNARLIFEYTDRIRFTAKEGAQTEAPQEINCKENKSEESKGRVNELKTTGSICESSRNKKFFGSGKAVIPYAANYQCTCVCIRKRTEYLFPYKKYKRS